MKIQEIIAENFDDVQHEASYEGNLGFEEVAKFFIMAEMKNPKLAQQVEDMLENDQDSTAWKVIQEFLGVKLQGSQFENTEELTELESPEQKRLRHQKDLDDLERDLRGAGASKGIDKAVTARRLRLARDKFGVKPSMPAKKPAGKQKVYHIETATAGSTSAGNIASIANPHLSPGKDRGNKSYTGSPGKSGTKSPAQPKVVQQKKSDGTAKGAHEVGGNLFGGDTIKRK